MAVMKERACAWCGASFFADKRHKYCSEQCYEEAHKEQARVRYRVRYANQREQELARFRDYYKRNASAMRERARVWRENNPEVHRENQRRLYRKRKGAQQHD